MIPVRNIIYLLYLVDRAKKYVLASSQRFAVQASAVVKDAHVLAAANDAYSLVLSSSCSRFMVHAPRVVPWLIIVVLILQVKIICIPPLDFVAIDYIFPADVMERRVVAVQVLQQNY
jgi:hypothetical protein